MSSRASGALFYLSFYFHMSDTLLKTVSHSYSKQTELLPAHLHRQRAAAQVFIWHLQFDLMEN